MVKFAIMAAIQKSLVVRWVIASLWLNSILLKKWKNLKTSVRQEKSMNEIKRRRKRRSRYYTGEDIDMFREREQERRKSREDNICDTHIDGA